MAERAFSLASLHARDLVPNRWDVIAFPLLFALFTLVGLGAHEAWEPIGALKAPTISLDPAYLPEYALRTTLRMLAAMVASLLFTFIYGTFAAKSRRAALILIPLLDILQSVPVLGYISFTVVFFLSLFPGRYAGAELAAIFAIFTSQAWNLTFSFYQSLRTLPQDLEEAAASLRFSAWQRFWRLEVPFAMPGLVWNMMMSMSGGWFFVVASEAITVGRKTIVLPGIGAYLAHAIDEHNLAAVGWAIAAMTVVIALYDQLLFRPLVAWADKFRFEMTAGQAAPESWLLNVLRRSRLTRAALMPLGMLAGAALRLRILPPRAARIESESASRRSGMIDVAWFTLVGAIAAYGAWHIVLYVAGGANWSDVWTVFRFGIYTLIRVVVLIALASLVWVPVGVMIGLRPRLAQLIQPIAQFLAAFPANLFFPVFAVAIVRTHTNADIWLSPLMILGTQWYILFNVIAGTLAYPNEYREAAANFRIAGFMWWRQAMLPGIFPYYITGAITASGGAWNASIVSEVVSWGRLNVTAHGLGAYIAERTAAGDFPRIVLGIAMMSLFVTLFNRLVWRPLYRYAENRFRIV